jgi:hypothetical protein
MEHFAVRYSAWTALMITGPVLAAPYSDEVLVDQPIAYWQFEETSGNTAADSSTNSFSGTFIGNLTLAQPSATPLLGNAIALSGGYVDVPAIANSVSQVSIEIWLNVPTINAGCCTSIYSADAWAGGNHHYNFKGTIISHALNGGNPNDTDTPSGTWLTDTWHHLVTTYDSTVATNNTLIYLDGNLVFTGNHANQSAMNLVEAQIGAWNATRQLIGGVDEFAIYDSLLSPGRIQAHFEAAWVPEPSGLAFTRIHLDPVSDRLALQWTSRDQVLYDLLYSNDPTATFDPSAWSIITNGVSGTESSTEIFLPDFQGQSWSTVAPWWVFRLREQ